MSNVDLQRLADRVELNDLVVRYANAIDTRNFERLDTVFTPDAYIDYRAMGGIDGPYPTVKAWLPQALGHFPGFMHMTGNAEFDIQGDRASGRIACFNPMVVPQPGGGSDTMFLGLWYLDEYVRTADGWRISRRSEEKCYEFNMPDWMKKALQK
ncbi:MAG TPA: nuclear transport factor 2 family protein [Fontimonas sp.]